MHKIQTELDTRMTPVHEVEKKLLGELADGVAAGKVDAAKADVELAEVAKVAGAVRMTSAELIKQLHDVLKPEERAALVDKVDAQWQVWRDANIEELPASTPHAEKKEKDEHGRLARLASDLDLKPDQLDKIKEGLKAKSEGPGTVDTKLVGEVEARLKAFHASFTSETFDPKVLGASDTTDSHLVAAGVTRMVTLCEVAAPILTPEQRTKFAAHIREHRMDMDAKEKEGHKEAPGK